MNQLPEKIIHNGETLELYTGQEAIREIKIQTIDDIQKIYHFEEINSFRGQSDSTWNLTSSLERNAVNATQSELEKMIFNIYGKFTQKDKLTFDDLADMQHYGVPTRLLDFTSSFDVALYFASSNNSEVDAAVFCLKNIVHSFLSIQPEDILKGYGINVPAKSNIDKNKLLSKFSHQEEKNYRVKAQKGYFIHTKSSKFTFEDSLSYAIRDLDLSYLDSNGESFEDILKKSTLVKVIIPSSLKKEILEYLNSKNINDNTIYPNQKDDFLIKIKPVVEYIKYNVTKFNFVNKNI